MKLVYILSDLSISQEVTSNTTPDAASAPSLYTDEHLSGLYTLMMFDPDNPPPANSTSTQTQEFLHWIQPGLVSSNTSTIVNGKQVYELLNPWNVSALAPYLEPGPPFKFPYFHRYIELLLYTPTQNSSVLYQAAQSRSPFHAQQVITDANLTVVAGNWFNSSNPQALIGNPSGNASITPTQTGGPAAVSTSSAGKLEGLKWATEYMILLYIAGWLLL